MLNNRSIKHKLRLIYIAASLVALLFAGSAFIVLDLISTRDTLAQRLAIQAEIVGSNASVALLFDDKMSAQEILSAVEADPEILSARIIDSQQAVFATYRRRHNTNTQTFMFGILNQPLVIHHAIVYKGRSIGSVEIVSDLPILLDRLYYYLVSASLILLLSFLISYIISYRMQRIILTPIMKLVNVTRQVAKEKNYNLRTDKISDDEIGILADNFNTMLAQIQLRDENLELQVKDRTSDLLVLNKRLAYRATHDALTQLANRALFNDHIQQAIIEAKRHDSFFAVLFLDLDQFKLINDTMGHDVGDQLLYLASRRLSQCIRGEDTLARQGGDEFTILLKNITRPDDAALVAQHVLQVLEKPFQISEGDFHISCSIGICIYPGDGEEESILQKNADTAMYSAKADGGSCFKFFSSQMGEKTLQRLQSETDLRKALEKGEMLLYYQPQVDNQGRLVAMEALIRWMGPNNKIVTPENFISIAEQSGLIFKLGEWVIREACRQQLIWMEQNLVPVPVHINISPRQFKDKRLAEFILSVVTEHGLEPGLIGCEITENAFFEDIEQSIKILNQLHSMGFCLSLDDFGTGYSSLGYLRRLPFNILKIDRCFVSEIERHETSASLVSGIIDLAHSLQLKVVAEGVETQLQHQFLFERGCDYIQGYYLARPMPAAAMTAWMQTRRINDNQPIITASYEQ